MFCLIAGAICYARGPGAGTNIRAGAWAKLSGKRRPHRSRSSRVADSDDGAAVLHGECPFDSRDDVQERNDPGNREDPFNDRCSPQHDIELAIEFNGVFLRL